MRNDAAGSTLLLLCVGGAGGHSDACGAAERVMIRKRLQPLVVRLRTGNSSSSCSISSSMSGFSQIDLADAPSIIAHHAAVAVLWSNHALQSSPTDPSSSQPQQDPSLWLSSAVIQAKALFSLVQQGSSLSNRERLLSRHSHWMRLPSSPISSPVADGIKEVLEAAADAIGEIIWPGGSRDRVLIPKCQLRLKKVYDLKQDADATILGGDGSGASQNSSSSVICMIVPTLTPHGVSNASQLPLLDIFLSSFVRSVGCDKGGEDFEFAVYVAFDQVKYERFRFKL